MVEDLSIEAHSEVGRLASELADQQEREAEERQEIDLAWPLTVFGIVGMQG